MKGSKKLSGIILLALLIAAMILSFIYLPLFVFALFTLITFFSAYFIYKLIIQKDPEAPSPDKKSDQNLKKSLETLQKTSKGKKIGRR